MGRVALAGEGDGEIFARGAGAAKGEGDAALEDHVGLVVGVERDGGEGGVEGAEEEERSGETQEEGKGAKSRMREHLIYLTA